MIYILVVDTVVLLLHWNRRFSCRMCFHIVVAVGEVLTTDVNLGDVVEVLDPLFSPTVYQLRSWVCFVVLRSVQYRGVFVSFRCSSSCIHGFLMIHLSLVVSALSPSYGGKEFSTLQKLLWFVPSYFDWVEVRRRIDTCSIPLVRASGKNPHTVLDPRLAASLMNKSKPFFCLGNLVLPVLLRLSAIPASSCPNESLRQVVFQLDRGYAPIF